jgi:hypothetical protein
VNSKPVERDRALKLMRDHPLKGDREIARELGVSNKSVSRWRTAERVPRGQLPEALTTSEVIAGAAKAGAVVTSRQLLRWLKLGLLPPWAAARVFPGRGSATYWWPNAIEQVCEIDRLLRRTRSSRDATLGLIAGGYPIDEMPAQEAYVAFLKAVRDGELLVPRLGTSKRALARLRRRSLWGTRWWLDFVSSERGIQAMSYEARWAKELGLPGDLGKQSVLHDQLEGSRQIVRGRLDSWREDNFMNAVADPPPPELLGELHRRLAFTALRRAVMKVNVEELHATAIGLGAFLLQTSDLILERTKREEDFQLFGDLELTRRWHADYREILFADPVTPARLVPFLLSIAESEQLEPLMSTMFVEVALRYPDWRAMVLALTTWPQLSWGDWRVASGRAS